MTWNTNHQSVLDAFAQKFGLPALDGDSARAWTFKLAQQFNFKFPTEGWGTKRASSSRPMSTDIICTQSPFVGFDVIKDQGAPNQSLNNLVGSHGEDLTGQVFIATPAQDWLGGTTTTPPPNTNPVPPTVVYVPMEFPHIPDNEFTEVSIVLEAYYKDKLNRGELVSYVDLLGATRWRVDYLTARARGKNHVDALQAMLDGLYAVTGIR